MVERGGGTRGGGERTQSTNRMNGWMKSSLMTLFGLCYRPAPSSAMGVSIPSLISASLRGV